MDFSLLGILAEISGALARHEVGIFAISTFNTDYILVKDKDYKRSEKASWNMHEVYLRSVESAETHHYLRGVVVK